MPAIDIIATTTGTNVLLPDLGFLELNHPSSINLTDIFDASELADSDDLQLAITNGQLNLQNESGTTISSVTNIQQPEQQQTSAGPITGLYAYATTDENGNLLESRGIASCTRTATGVYAYLFENQAPTPNYAVSGQPENLPKDTDTNVFIGSKGRNGFEIRVGRGDNSSSTDVLQNHQHSVWVLGPTAAGAVGDSDGIITNKESVVQDSIVKFADSTGKIITDSTAQIDSSGINLPASANYKKNGRPLILSDMADVATTTPGNTHVLTYSTTTQSWSPSATKAFWTWQGALSQSKASGTRAFEGLANVRQDRSPYIVFTNSFIYAITLVGEALNQPYFADLMVNDQQLTTAQRLGTNIFTSYTGLFIALNANSTFWLRFRETEGDVAYPSVICYLRQL